MSLCPFLHLLTLICQSILAEGDICASQRRASSEGLGLLARLGNDIFTAKMVSSTLMSIVIFLMNLIVIVMWICYTSFMEVKVLYFSSHLEFLIALSISCVYLMLSLSLSLSRLYDDKRLGCFLVTFPVQQISTMLAQLPLHLAAFIAGE